MSKLAIPQNSAELEELLNDDSRRSEVFSDPEATKEFLAAYTKATNKGEALTKQIQAGVQETLAEMLKENGITDRPDQTQVEAAANAVMAKPGSGAEFSAAHNPNAPGAKLDGVTNSLGEIARLVNPKIGKTSEQREQLAKFEDVRNAYTSEDPASAGFLIPEDERANILSLALEQSIIRPRSTVITMSSLTTKIPYVDSQGNASSVFGGMVFYWTEEQGNIIATEAKFGKAELSAKKLTGGARVPNELWNDASALSTWLMQAAPAGLAYYEDTAFIRGTGVGEPLGIYNADAKVAAARTTAGGVTSTDIFGMYARMLPTSLGRGVWLANQETLPALLSLTVAIENQAGSDNVGGSVVGLVQGSVASGFPLSILGRPLIITEKASALNSEGDIAFVDPAHYLIGDRQAMSVDASEHSRFMNDETELRIIERVDGRPWLNEAITPANGTSTLSPFVVLEAD